MAGLLRASEEGLKIIDMVRRSLGWNKADELWCQAAITSKATLKRFWVRQPIRRETFPESEWQHIEDIQPLIRAHYHGCEAGDLDAANAIISGVDEYLRVGNYPEQICSNPPLPLLANGQEVTENLSQDSDV